MLADGPERASLPQYAICQCHVIEGDVFMAADIMKEPEETCDDMIDVDILEIDGRCRGGWFLKMDIQPNLALIEQAILGAQDG
jgi:predicted DNA-binding helix-hairpin-helix protein